MDISKKDKNIVFEMNPEEAELMYSGLRNSEALLDTIYSEYKKGTNPYVETMNTYAATANIEPDTMAAIIKQRLDNSVKLAEEIESRLEIKNLLEDLLTEISN